MERELIGQAFNYELLDLIGEGTNSRVFKALRTDKDGFFQDLVVLKILKSRNSDQNTRQQLGSLRAVQCVHVAPLLAWDFWQQTPLLTFEFTDSVSLRDLLSSGPIELGEAGEIVRQIQIGLQSLSASGLCHGDLSPGNILIDVNGRIRLIDYGLANVIERVGTYPYVAPEVVAGGWATASSDLYSLGVLLREMIGSRWWAVDLRRAVQQWCRPDPARRSWFSFRERTWAQNSLGSRVGRLLGQRRVQTQSLSQYPSSDSLSGFGYSRLASLWVALLALTLSQIPAVEARAQRWGELFIQTSKWIEVEINGRSHGFTPLRTGALPVGRVEIKWQGPLSGGMRTLTLQAGQNIVLGDAFFTSEGKGELVGRHHIGNSSRTY